MKSPHPTRTRAFTLVELLVVISIIGILAAMLLPTLSKAKRKATAVSCVNNLKQLAAATQMYLDENRNYYPIRTNFNRWPNQIYPEYKNTAILRCPNDGDDPKTWGSSGAQFPGDNAPRSYIINGWNDFMKKTLSDDDFTTFMNGNYTGSLRADLIRRPSDTVVYGEKLTDSKHYFMDLLEEESDGNTGNDLYELDRSRHSSREGKNSGVGGSNYSLVDNSVRFVKYDRILGPENLWAATDEGRTNYAVNQ